MSGQNFAPFAEQRLTSVNLSQDGVNRPPKGMVLHIAQGTYEGTIGWEHNPKARVSSYFVVGKEGQIAQVVSLADKAWTQSSGNSDWIGVEFAGFVPDKLTPEQVHAAAVILAWLHTEHGVVFAKADSPSQLGLGWHGMGGSAWGSHFGCPGDNIVAQRDEIIARASKLVGTPVPIPTPGGKVANPIKTIVDPNTHSAWTLLDDGGVLTEHGNEFYGAWGTLPAQTRTDARVARFYDFTLRFDGKPGYTIWVLSKTGATLDYNFPLGK